MGNVWEVEAPAAAGISLAEIPGKLSIKLWEWVIRKTWPGWESQVSVISPVPEPRLMLLIAKLPLPATIRLREGA